MRRWVGLAWMALAACGGPTVHPLDIGGHTLHVELADEPIERRRGLAGRSALAPDHGMLFVFHAEEPQALWMKETGMPLSAAFVDARGRITNVAALAPHSREQVRSSGRVLYAIEAPAGWFQARAIGSGTVVTGLPPAAPR